MLPPSHSAYYRASAPVESQPRKDGVCVWVHAPHTGRQRCKMTSWQRCQPSLKLPTCALADQLEELVHQLVGRLTVWTRLPQQAKALQRFLLSLIGCAEKEPGCLLDRPRASADGVG
jgi:hypothetical protein